jgi:hypothetical protein
VGQNLLENSLKSCVQEYFVVEQPFCECGGKEEYSKAVFGEPLVRIGWLDGSDEILRLLFKLTAVLRDGEDGILTVPSMLLGIIIALFRVLRAGGLMASLVAFCAKVRSGATPGCRAQANTLPAERVTLRTCHCRATQRGMSRGSMDHGFARLTVKSHEAHMKSLPHPLLFLARLLTPDHRF